MPSERSQQERRPVTRARPTALGYDTLRLEGALLLPDVLEKAAQGNASLQTADAYHVPKGFTVQEEYGRAFRIAQAQWKAFSSTFERDDLDPSLTTRGFVEEFLRDALGYADLHRVEPIAVGERRFPIDALAANVLPVVIASHNLELDDPAPRFAPAGGGARRKSAFQLVQEFLNVSSDCNWGLVTNGRRLRLVRDAATLTRPSFIEFDLETILAEARYPDFAALWRLLHASRAGKRGEAVWENWRTDGQREGSRVREGLRVGVTAALQRLGAGFLEHPANKPLRLALISGQLPKKDYFEQLLRLVYRCIFLFAVEERALLHPRDESPEAAIARQIYREGYSAARLRERCLRRLARDAHDDLWQALAIVFRALASGESRLALPALGGLFAGDQCPDLDAAALSNRALLDAMRHLRWSAASGSLAPVDYRNMGPEELGSVYESLLELVPDPDPHARTFGFIGADGDGSTQGNTRKTSGSYYTPDSLVQELIKSALDPVIEARIAAQPDRPTDALLSISVVDPACGSGHFLLSAARRLAERLAALRAPEGAVRAQDYRHALREVITHCVYGVDRNPMALELARFALWLEGFEEGRPLGFLDHHLVCGDALIGITDITQLGHGVPDAAFKPLSGDDRAICKALAKENKEGLKAFAKRKADPNLPLGIDRDTLLAERTALEAMPDETLAEAAAKQAAYEDYLRREGASRLKQAADLFVGAFLAPKADQAALDSTPTSRNLYLALFTETRPDELPEARQAERLARAEALSEEARVLHWPLKFVQVFARGGFDCVLGNPPWERIKLQEEEFFANENRLVAEAKNKAERAQRIDWLSQGMLARHIYPDLEQSPDEPVKEKSIYAKFIAARRITEAMSVFAHLKGGQGGRYPLTGVGDVNTYALFAETIYQLIGKGGRAGFIVPTGIATDDSTKKYFEHLAHSGRLCSLYDFENREGLFPAIDSRMKFCLLTLGTVEIADFGFFFTQTAQLADARRRFTLSADDFSRINPNTLNCPVFRSQKDAELNKKIYALVPVLLRDERDGEQAHNPWTFDYMTKMFDMADSSHEFLDYHALVSIGDKRSTLDWPYSDGLTYAPLYEAKHVHLFDHRWASSTPQSEEAKPVDVQQKADPNFSIATRYWIPRQRVEERLRTKHWSSHWLTGWRDIARATDERSVIAAVVPRVAAAHTLRIAFVVSEPRLTAAFVACLSSLTIDYLARQKIGGTHLTVETLKQLPILPPSAYSDIQLDFIVPRVLELTYSAHDMAPWAKDLGFDGPPFPFDSDRRAQLRAELDAYYARLYGLSRDDLCYILDPASVMGVDYPSETFRVLKNNEERDFGDYRTQRLVLAAWDALERGKAH